MVDQDAARGLPVTGPCSVEQSGDVRHGETVSLLVNPPEIHLARLPRIMWPQFGFGGQWPVSGLPGRSRAAAGIACPDWIARSRAGRSSVHGLAVFQTAIHCRWL